MREIELGPRDYRVKGRQKVRFTFFEALSFAIGSTLATRKRSAPDPDKVGRLIQAGFLGWVWFITHNGQ